MFLYTPGVYKSSVLTIEIEHVIVIEHGEYLSVVAAGAAGVDPDVAVVAAADHDFAFCQTILGDAFALVGNDYAGTSATTRRVRLVLCDLSIRALHLVRTFVVWPGAPGRQSGAGARRLPYDAIRTAPT